MMTLSLGMLLTGCQSAQSEKDMIAEAQFCLDEANDANSAGACINKISGLNSPQANTLRCAAGFIAAEVTSPKNLSTALNAINDGAGAPALMSALSFPSVDLAKTTFEYCNASSQNGLKLIGAMAKSATILASIATGLPSCSSETNCDASAIEATLSNLITALDNGNNPAANESVIEIVSSVQAVYSSTCSGNTNSNADICKQINTAIADSGYNVNTQDQAELLAIGKELLSQWKK